MTNEPLTTMDLIFIGAPIALIILAFAAIAIWEIWNELR
jgi:hypothetical protein